MSSFCGIPPAKNGDYAFLLHLIASLKSTGKGAIILPHGVLFRGNKEADIRRDLIKHGYIKIGQFRSDTWMSSRAIASVRALSEGNSWIQPPNALAFTCGARSALSGAMPC